MKIIITEEQYKLIKEETLKQTLIDQINVYGWEDTSNLVGGSDDMVKILDIKTPEDYLNLYDLKMVETETNIRFDFLNKNDELLMVYLTDMDELIIDFAKFYEPYIFVFQNKKRGDSIKTTDLKNELKRWFESKYDLPIRRFTPTYLD